VDKKNSHIGRGGIKRIGAKIWDKQWQGRLEKDSGRSRGPLQAEGKVKETAPKTRPPRMGKHPLKGGTGRKRSASFFDIKNGRKRGAEKPVARFYPIVFGWVRGDKKTHRGKTCPLEVDLRGRKKVIRPKSKAKSGIPAEGTGKQRKSRPKLGPGHEKEKPRFNKRGKERLFLNPSPAQSKRAG